MELPDPLFILALVPEGGPTEERMVLFSLPSEEGDRLTPVFSSMQLAAGFLEQAQQLGRRVPIDYVFRAAGAAFASQFPGYKPMLDPSAKAFFQEPTGDAPP